MSKQSAPAATSQIVRTPCTLNDIEMGARAVAQFPATQERFLTTFTGIEVGQFIQLSLPGSASKRDQLYEGAPLTVRYLHRGQVRGFETRVLASIQLPFALLFLEFPRHIEMLEMRRHPRVNCFLPVTLYYGDAAGMAVMLNLSQGGCRLFLENRDKALPPLIVGQQIMIKARLYESYGDMQFQGAVRNVPSVSPNLNLGVRFKFQDQESQAAVKTHLKCMRDLGDLSS